MSSTFRHNKKRNCGLVYEFLIRRMALTMVEKDASAYVKTIDLLKKYYSSGQPLAKEKDAFDALVRSRGLNERAARNVLEEVKKHVADLDVRKIEIKKSNLIKDIHYTFGQDFFSVHRIPEYRLYASVHMLVEQYKRSSSSINEGMQRIQLEESLVRYMMSNFDEEVEQNRGEKVDGLVASLAMKKFEQRYSGSLNESQKRTLRRFMNYSMTGNAEQFRREMNEDREYLLEKLQTSSGMSCFKEDQVMAQKLAEATDILQKMEDVTSECAVQDVLLFHKLVEELDSDE